MALQRWRLHAFQWACPMQEEPASLAEVLCPSYQLVWQSCAVLCSIVALAVHQCGPRGCRAMAKKSERFSATNQHSWLFLAALVQPSSYMPWLFTVAFTAPF
jgi:hypothetical protein